MTLLEENIDAVSRNFTPQSPGGSLAVGANTITLRPVPQGVNGTNTNHYLYISNGTGAAEAVRITGGSAVAGATSGTITFTCANTHTVAWTIQSATAGIQESLYSVLAPGVQVAVPHGSYTIYAQIYVPYQRTAWIVGAGWSATVINVDPSFSLAHSGVFVFSPAQVTATNANSGGVKGMTISFTQPDSTNVATYTHWPPAMYASGNNHVTLEDVIVERAWDVFLAPLSNGITVRNVGMSFFHRGLIIDQAFDIVVIQNVEAWVYGLSANQTAAFVARSTNNYTLDLQGVDFCWINGLTSVAGKFATLHKNGGGSVPMVVASNIDMDTNGGWEQSNGYARLSNVSVSLLAGTEAFVVTGGTLAIDGIAIFNSGATATHFLYNVSQANAGAAAGLMPGLTITNLKLSSNAEDGFIVYGTTSGAFAGTAYVRVAGAEIVKSPGVSYANSLFAEAPGTGSVIMDISHVHVSSNGGTAAGFANFTSPLAHSISFCEAPGGWDIGVPNSTRVLYNSGFPSIGIPVYANNAAAISGGLSKGQFYRSGGDPDVTSIVH